MKTVWTYSPKTEACRLIWTANDIASGFFRANNFPITPFGGDTKCGCCIIFPRLAYDKIPRFWTRIRKLDANPWPDAVNDPLTGEIIRLMKGKIPLPDFSSLQSLWKKAEKPLLKEIYRLLPRYNNAIESIEIYPTRFGSSCSFNIPKTFPARLTMYLREDQGLHEIVEAILSSLTRVYVFENLNGSWSESELLVDFLIQQSSLSAILNRFQPGRIFNPTMKKIRSVQKGDVMRTSKAFYKTLGFPENDTIFRIGNNAPTINEKALNNLTAREEKILVELIKNRGRILTYDRLEKILFSDEDSFSFYVIAKVIQNLRDKLEKYGVSGSYIQTVRKKGFLIN